MKSKLLLIALAALGLTACTGQVMNKDNPGQPGSNPNTVNLERDWQEVITYDCFHNVKSDQVQTVVSPVKLVTIPPKDYSNLGSSSFLNTATGSSPLWVSGYTTFNVDYSYGALNMHVGPGINTVNYTFYSCDQWTYDQNGNKQGCAVAKTVQESGTVTFNIIYVEKTLPGTSTAVDCPSPTPTPSPTPPTSN